MGDLALQPTTEARRRVDEVMLKPFGAAQLPQVIADLQRCVELAGGSLPWPQVTAVAA
jgi:hypothetical protein